MIIQQLLSNIVKGIILKKLLYCLILVSSILSLFILSSCTPSMGVFDKEENNFGFDDYYSSFGDIVGKYEENNSFTDDSYDIEKSITNENIMEFLEWEDGAKKVEFRQYVYIVIPFERDLKIESLALYFASNSTEPRNVELEFSLFYFKDSDSCPKDNKLKKQSDPDTKTEDGKEVVIEYGDPKKDDRIAYSTLNVNHTFEDVYFENFHQTTTGDSYVSDNCLLAKEDSYLYIRVENNSALNRDMTPISISFMNLLVRAI